MYVNTLSWLLTTEITKIVKIVPGDLFAKLLLISLTSAIELMASDILVYFLWHGKQWHFTSFHLEIILQWQWVLALTFETYVPQVAFNWKMAKKVKQIGNWKIHLSWKEGTVANLSRCNQTGKKLSRGFDHPRNELPVSAELFSPSARRGTSNEKNGRKKN